MGSSPENPWLRGDKRNISIDFLTIFTINGFNISCSKGKKIPPENRWYLAGKMDKTVTMQNATLLQLIKPYCKGLAFFLIVVLLATRLGSYTHGMFAGPIQEHISQIALVCADEESPEKTPYLFKVKRLLSDIVNPEQIEIVFVLAPALDPQHPAEEFTIPPDVYLDIVVPPDEDPVFFS